MNNSPAHDALARKSACESIVLLKNQGNLLPLSKSLKTVAVIGPNSDEVQSLWGNYNGIPVHPVTILQGIRNKIEPQAEVLYAQGCDLADGVPFYKPIPSIYLETADGKQGLLGEYFSNNNLEGEPLFRKTDDQIDFNWDIITPDPRLELENTLSVGAAI